MQVSNLTPVIGAEIDGIDLSQDFNADWLTRLLAEKQVLVFRHQSLDDEAQKRVARMFGTGQLHTHSLTRDGDPEILPVFTNAESKFTAGEGWHTDVSCDPNPIAASLLYMKQMPEGGGGDTCFASMTECYRRLSDPIRALIGNLNAVHDGALPWKTVYGIDPKPGMQYNKTSHPLVVPHPVTGQPVLWINRGFTTKIEGLTPVENRNLMELLFQHIETCLIAQCRVRWANNTLVIWDNVATQHHAVWDYYPQTRHAQRVSAIGPVLNAA